MENLQFARRGHRRKEGFGLSYFSTCKRYRLYHGDIVGHVRWADHGLKPRWYAHRVEPDGRVLHVISRHRSKERAAAACEADLRRLNSPPKRRQTCKKSGRR